MTNNNDPNGEEPAQEREDELGSASDEVWLAMADILRRKEIREAAKKWIDAQSENIPKNQSYRVQQLWLAYGFAVVVFAGITSLAVIRLITPEVMVSLLGPLLGYWFGRHSG
jgi:hypothetical protein